MIHRRTQRRFLEPIGLRWYDCRHLISRDKEAQNELTYRIWRRIKEQLWCRTRSKGTAGKITGVDGSGKPPAGSSADGNAFGYVKEVTDDERPLWLKYRKVGLAGRRCLAGTRAFHSHPLALAHLLVLPAADTAGEDLLHL